MTVLIAGGGIGGLTLALSLHDKLDAHAVRTKELAYFSKHGKPIWSEPRGIEAGYKWPQFSIHRGTLQQILLDAATERLGKENILTSHHLSGWTETTDGVPADLERAYPVARHHRSQRLPVRPHHDHGRP